MNWTETIQAIAEELNLIPLWNEEIKSDDLYLAYRNRGPELLTCRRNDKENGWIVPKEIAYVYNIGECVKVIEKE